MIAPERHIIHVTLTTGHSRRSPRSEVADDALDACRELLAAAPRGGAVIPGTDGGYVLRMERPPTRCFVATVHRATNAVLGAYGPPLVTIGVASRNKCGLPLWISLHDRPLVTSRDACPPAPWCAVRLEPALAGPDPSVAWLGDFERCLAWAFIEGIER